MENEQKNELSFEAAVQATLLNASSIIAQITNLAVRDLASEKDKDAKAAKMSWLLEKFDMFAANLNNIRTFLD